jgi:high-affinity iron transporter
MALPYASPVARGAGMGFVATLATWFIMGAMISAVNAPVRDVQAAISLVAAIVCSRS